MAEFGLNWLFDYTELHKVKCFSVGDGGGLAGSMAAERITHMKQGKLVTVRPGVVAMFGKKRITMRYYVSINGKRYTTTGRLPYADAVNQKTHKPTKALNEDYAVWCMSLESDANARTNGLKIPTIRELMEEYDTIANERLNNPLFGKPGTKAINATLYNVRHVYEAAGLTDDRLITDLFDKHTVQKAFDVLGRQVRAISAWSYILGLKSITAHWAINKYEARGYLVEPAKIPDKPTAANAPQYHLLPDDKKEKINNWYMSLADCPDRNMRLAASMTYQLAVRPIDTGYITADNFRQDPSDGLVHLVYKPHKTQMSSGRIVDWPVLPALWKEIREIAGERLDAGHALLRSPVTTYKKLNASMRAACDMTGNKAVYELRKLCIDTIRRTMSSDHAVAISGDRRDTIDKYYSDPYKMIDVTPIEIGPMSRPPAGA